MTTAMNARPDSIISHHPDLVGTEVDGYTMLMSIEAGRFFSLNPIGSRIWALVEQPARVRDVCATLVAEYEVSPEQCQADVADFIDRLAEAGLVQVGD